MAKKSTSQKCPHCGQKRADLEGHIKRLHPKEASKNPPKNTPKNKGKTGGVDKSGDKGTTGEMKMAEYIAFIDWCALPRRARGEIRTQGDFAKKYDVSEDTLSRWKKREGFYKKVQEATRRNFKLRTPNVIDALYRTILRDGKGLDAKVFLEYVEDLNKKLQLEDVTPYAKRLEKEEAMRLTTALHNLGLKNVVAEEDSLDDVYYEDEDYDDLD